jgi:Transposase DDE domain
MLLHGAGPGCGLAGGDTHGQACSPSWNRSVVPFKHHAEHRHHIPKPRYRVTNWPEYDASLKRRGSLTVWFTDEAIRAWRAEPRTTPGGQPHYSTLAITTALTMGMVFHLALRQTEGLIGSVIGLLGLDLAVPDHSTLSRRARTLDVPSHRRGGTGPLHLLVDSTGLKLGGAGEWLIEKHGASRRRSWRKLHIGVDADTGEIVAVAVTRKDIDDATMVDALLDQIADPITSFTADGAYDQDQVSQAVAERHPEAAVIVPPRAGAVVSASAETAPTQRDRHLRMIAERGRMAWQKASGYNLRAKVEASIGRASTRARGYKRVIGDALRSRTDRTEATEVALAAAALNRMLGLGRPNCVRIA